MTMLRAKEIKEILKEKLKPDRYTHTLGVMKTAKKLAEQYGCDVKKAKYAGLLHDCAKELTDNEKRKLCKKYHMEITPAEDKNPSLLHAKCGSILAKELYGVSDAEILHAIEVHTTGCPNMSLLDKIIYVADYIEPNRKQAPHLTKLRAMAEVDLDQTVFQIAKDTISYLKKNQNTIDETTMDVYNFYSSYEK